MNTYLKVHSYSLELGMFTLKNRRLWGDLVASFQYFFKLTKKMESNFLFRQIMIGQDGMVLN